jgi:hypothetical protein
MNKKLSAAAKWFRRRFALIFGAGIAQASVDLRHEALHPRAIVVRAGIVRDAQVVLKKAQRAADEGFGHVLSVHCDVYCTDDGGLTAEQLWARTGLPHKKMQLSRVETLQEAGIELILDTSDGQPETHHNAKLPEPVGESSAQRFIDCFDMPIPTSGGKEAIP